MQYSRKFVFQENFFTGANIVLGDMKINLQSDELVCALEAWEESVPLLQLGKIQKPEEFLK